MTAFVPFEPGTIEVTSGSKSIVGTGTDFTAYGDTDTIWVDGIPVLLDGPPADATHALAKFSYPGASGAGKSYRWVPLPDLSKAMALDTRLSSYFASGNLEALAGLGGIADRLPYFSGAGTMDLAPFDANARDLFGQWTRASAAGPSSLVFLEDADEGANKVTLRAAAALGDDVDFVMDANGADLLLRWTRATAASPASLDFHEDTDDGVHRMRVSVPALTADRLFTLPDANVTMHAAAKGLLEAADAPGQRDAIGLDAVAALGGAYAAGGTASATTVTIAELWGGYASGQVLAIKMPSAAPGATTLNVTVPVVGALGAKAIRRQGDTAIQVNDWIAGAVLILRYDAAYNAAAGAWVLTNSSPGFATIAFEAYSSVNVLNGTLTKLAAGTEAIDVGGYYDAAANYRFQPPAGYYYLHAAAGPDGTVYGLSVDTGYVVLSLYKNGSLYRTLSYVQASTTTGLIAVGGCTVYSNGTDYWEAYMLHQSSATKQCIVEFGGIRVGS
jgi:hypothetical protein